MPACRQPEQQGRRSLLQTATNIGTISIGSFTQPSVRKTLICSPMSCSEDLLFTASSWCRRPRHRPPPPAAQPPPPPQSSPPPPARASPPPARPPPQSPPPPSSSPPPPPRPMQQPPIRQGPILGPANLPGPVPAPAPVPGARMSQRALASHCSTCLTSRHSVCCRIEHSTQHGSSGQQATTKDGSSSCECTCPAGSGCQRACGCSGAAATHWSCSERCRQRAGVSVAGRLRPVKALGRSPVKQAAGLHALWPCPQRCTPAQASGPSGGAFLGTADCPGLSALSIAGSQSPCQTIGQALTASPSLSQWLALMNVSSLPRLSCTPHASPELRGLRACLHEGCDCIVPISADRQCCQGCLVSASDPAG